MKKTALTHLFVLVNMAGLGGLPAQEANPASATDTPPPAADRAAILAMAGAYAVDFRFEETLALQPGYELTKPYQEDATELVVVAEDTPRRIVLQHLLLVGKGAVLQHWRQIWTYEDTRLTEFRGRNVWRARELDAATAKGAWTQMVTNVDNSPRYEGIGRWDHTGGVSSWTSGETWRPLPRREYSKRDDYDVVLAMNRHTLTPQGWAHEQINTKLDLATPTNRLLARETGLNLYVRTDKDLGVAQAWWETNRDFSNALTAVWEEVTAARDQYAIDDDIDTAKLRSDLKRLAATNPAPEERVPRIREVIHSFVKEAPDSDVAGVQGK
jgi:hypothetical protein